MSTISELWALEVKRNPALANNPVPFQTPMVKPVISNPIQTPAPVVNKSLFNSTAPVEERVKVPTNWINPTNGQLYSPQEYAANAVKKIPTGTAPKGDIGTYAGNAITEPNQSADKLTTTARNLNNARNDLAVGDTSLFAGSNVTAGGEKIIYSPAEQDAIRKASAGIYDPALNDVFTKLAAKQKADEKIAADEDWRKKQIFSTNESIRQWKATTGTKDLSDSSDRFTKTQLNNGAANAGMILDDFSALDGDLKNFYINPPMGKNFEDKSVPMYDIFNEALAEVRSGKSTAEQITQEIMDSNLPDVVKHYFINQMPLAPEVKDGFFTRIWKAVTNK